MDNLTHTLIGVLVGETAARTTSASQDGLQPQQRRNLMVTLAGIASNLPDLDFLASAISRNKLEYLLEHRGYTHTLLGTVLMAVLLWSACEGWCRWRKWTLSRSDRLQLSAVTLLALLLHVAMDFTNNYGVHPFWPFYNGWLYGDSVFIWEPLLWTAAAPLVFILRTMTARILVAALLATAIAVCLTSGLVLPAFAIFMTVLTAAMLLVGRYAPPRNALLSGIGVWLIVTGVFAISRSATEDQVRQFASQKMPRMTVLDFVLTPMPANPVCWDVMLPMTDDEHYVIRHGTWSLLPAWLPAANCPGRSLFRDITAPSVAVSNEDNDFALWHGEVRMPRAEIATLAATHCEASAFMRFARVPWTLRREHLWIIGDLRYDREPEAGFAELELADGVANCPESMPPWIAPRGDLLQQ